MASGPFGPDLKQAFTLQNLAMQTQLAQEEQQGRNTLRQLYGNPQFLDPKTNTLNQLGQQRLGQVSPSMLIDYTRFLSQDATRRAQEEGRRAVASKARDAKMDTLAEDAANFYLDRIKEGKDPRLASDLTTQKVWGPGIADLKSSGLCTGEECARLSSNFDYGRVSANRAVRKNQIEQDRAALAERREDRAETRAEAQTAQGAEHIDIERGKAKVEADKGQAAILERTAEAHLETDLAKARQSGNQDEIKKAEQAIHDHNLARGKGGAAVGAGSQDVDPQRASDLADQIGKYEIAPPGAYALGRSAELREAQKIVGQRYPGYSTGKYLAANKTRNDFAAGARGATNMDAINTIVQHLDVFDDVSKGLKNGDVPAINRVVNYVKTQLGRPDVTDFEIARNIVADEAIRAVVGSGAVFDREGMQRLLSSDRSGDQFAGQKDKIARLMAGRYDAMKQRWVSNNLSGDEFEDKLLPETAKLIQPYRKQASGGEAPAAAPSAATPRAGASIPPEAVAVKGDSAARRKQITDAPPGTKFYDPDKPDQGVWTKP